MMAESEFELKRMYSTQIVTLWLECLNSSSNAQVFILRGEAENDICLDYISRLTTLWKELKPKVKDRTELKDIMVTYMSFEDFARTPRMLLADPEKLYELEEIIRTVLDKLRLTTFETMRL
jgi:hypothetical protein